MISKMFINQIKYNLQKLIHKLGWHVSKYTSISAEQNPAEIVKTLLNKASDFTIIDGGAWVGNTSKSYSDIFVGGRIFAFEPFPDSYKKLASNTGKFDNITTIEQALAAKTGEVKFHSNRNETTNSLLSSTLGTDSKDYMRETDNVINVSTISLDDFCNQNDLSEIDFLKMDLQGAELEALKGAQKLLKQGKIKCIYSEIWFQQQYQDCPFYFEIAEYLNKFGFVTYRMFDLVVSEDGNLMWGDALFVHKSLLKK